MSVCERLRRLANGEAAEQSATRLAPTSDEAEEVGVSVGFDMRAGGLEGIVSGLLRTRSAGSVGEGRLVLVAKAGFGEVEHTGEERGDEVGGDEVHNIHYPAQRVARVEMYFHFY